MGRKGRKRAGKGGTNAASQAQQPASGQSQPRKRARRALDAAAVLAGSGARSGEAPRPSKGGSRQKAASPPASRGQGKASSLQQQFRRKLEGAKFRKLNELLYTSSGDDAFQHFKDQPSDFQLVEKWPVNPLDLCIKYVTKRPGAVVGDFGCGEAQLAASVDNTVHSFDLVAANERVTACDVRHVPLEDGSLDVAVFCLSLMGVNYIDFLREARRTLKPGGHLVVAEVRSRFAGDAGDARAGAAAAAPDAAGRERAGLERFSHQLRALGFDPLRKDASSTMFVWMELRRSDRAVDEGALARTRAALQPCLYKRR